MPAANTADINQDLEPGRHGTVSSHSNECFVEHRHIRVIPEAQKPLCAVCQSGGAWHMASFNDYWPCRTLRHSLPVEHPFRRAIVAGTDLLDNTRSFHWGFQLAGVGLRPERGPCNYGQQRLTPGETIGSNNCARKLIVISLI